LSETLRDGQRRRYRLPALHGTCQLAFRADRRWYRGAIVRGGTKSGHGRALWAAALLGACLPLLAACGGGSRLDAHEPSGTFTMQVVRARFAAVQSVARVTPLELVVRNTGTSTVPNVAVTLDSLLYTEHFPELASSKRPVWVIERGPGAIAFPPVETQEVSPPGGGQTAYVNTWALGELAPGASRTFRWLLAPVKPGTHVVHYRVAAGLAGKATAATQTGAPVQGSLLAQITPAPPVTHVNPSTGKVEPGPAPSQP
jgi:hypothetical protein